MKKHKKAPKAILTNRLYVREDDIDEEVHLPPFTYKYKERVFDEMFGESVIVEQEHASYKHNERKGLYAFHRGNLGKIREVFKDFNIVDKRVKPPLGFKLKRRYKLRPEQKKAVREWRNLGYGIIKAPVRWGKTFAGSYLVSKCGTTALLLSDKKHLCRQWYKHFLKMTNIRKLEKKLGKKLIGIITRGDDKLYPISISTFQTLWSRQKRVKLLSKNKNFFGFVLTDEAHHVPAETYGGVTSTPNARYRCGVTATDRRRDKKHFLLYDIIGPVTGIGEKEQLPCDVIKHQTDVHIDPKAGWGWMVTLCTRNPDFNEMVVNQIVRDVQEGRFVLVHTERKKHCHELKEMIQDLDMSIKVGIAHGDVKIPERERLIKLMNKEKLHVIVGAKVIQEGLTFERPDVIHIGFSPTTNPDTWEQITGRVRTPMKDKPKPIIHDWRLRGHGGVYASGKARDKLYDKMLRKASFPGYGKWSLSESAPTGFGSGQDASLPPVPRFCGNCENFFACKEVEVKAKDTPCSPALKKLKWTPLRMNAKMKMRVVKAFEKRLRGDSSKRFVDSLASQNYSFWSRKQIAILQRIYEEILDHPKVWKWPKFVFERDDDIDDEERDND